METPPTVALPCPLDAGWQIVEQTVLPAATGGGYSAGAYRSSSDELWLLSDAPRGSISRWSGLVRGGLAGLKPLPPLPLSQPKPMDGEGLVLDGASFWVSSEGRLKPLRQAELLRYDLSTGQLQQRVELPRAWQLNKGTGLASNSGPESLTLLPATHALLMAAEKPLQQDPPDRVRLLRWQLAAAGATQATALQPLALPPGGWGLTDLLATADGLLGLWRRYQEPGQWQARLVLYPLPGDDPSATPLPPRQQWNLIRLGLPADNWEVLLAGPPLSDGRPSLVLASDDNFNPLQASHLVRLSPVQRPDCQP
ncbi:MAG: esterase-like activity of phytase family protein [Cyanobacteriota bacterium]|nr:esterase-like activity of phytase family protein [Cyanobacteriota bacterium]